MSIQQQNWGQIPWANSDLVAHLEEFATLYTQRPIQDNSGGMKSPHLFYTWFLLKKLQPKVVIESGVWRGQGTWFMEQAVPHASFHCIDPTLSRVEYRAKNATYYTQDFTTIDWSHLPKEDTVVFFDDHQDAYQRLVACAWMGFKHILFEDNYPSGEGDIYSLKKILSGSGHTPPPHQLTWRNRLSFASRVLLSKPIPKGWLSDAPILPNPSHKRLLEQNLAVYYEFPPIFKTEKVRWGQPWQDSNFPTPTPLLETVSQPYHTLYLNDATSYTWLCYVKLK